MVSIVMLFDLERGRIKNIKVGDVIYYGYLFHIVFQ